MPLRLPYRRAPLGRRTPLRVRSPALHTVLSPVRMHYIFQRQHGWARVRKALGVNLRRRWGRWRWDIGDWWLLTASFVQLAGRTITLAVDLLRSRIRG